MKNVHWNVDIYVIKDLRGMFRDLCLESLVYETSGPYIREAYLSAEYNHLDGILLF